MAPRGPKTKTNELRLLEGDAKKCRYNLDAPKAATLDSTDIPPRVNEYPDALAMWNYIVPRLVDMGVAGDVDRFALEALCVNYALWGEQPSAQRTARLQSLLAEFGLTPSSRTRLTGNSKGAQPADPIAARLAAI